jgi:hypothetical protein
VSDTEKLKKELEEVTSKLETVRSIIRTSLSYHSSFHLISKDDMASLKVVLNIS